MIRFFMKLCFKCLSTDYSKIYMINKHFNLILIIYCTQFINLEVSHSIVTSMRSGNSS